MTKISTLLTSIALASTPIFAQAYQIGPNPNPVGNTIEIIDEDAENLIHFTSYGSIFIDGSGNANGILNNYGILTNNGPLDIYEGSLNNYGTLEGNSGVSILFGGLNNYGTMNSGATIDASGLSNFGILNSYGLSANEGGLNNANILNSFGGINFSGSGINNTGTLNSHDSIFFEKSNLTNDSNGTFNNYGSSVFLSQSSINNNGIMNNYGTFTNSGLIENSNTIDGSGVFTQDADVSFSVTINNGSFSQTSFQFNGGEVEGGGSFTGDVTIASGAIVRPSATTTFNGDFHSSGDFVLGIAGTGTGLYSVLAINGNADFTGGDVLFVFTNNFHPAVGDHWNFLLADSITGLDSLNISFAATSLPNIDKIKGDITFDNLGGHLVITAVPEPSTYVMLLAGLGLLGFVAHRRKTVTI